MGSRVLQYSFLGGEIAPAMLGRLDNAMYQQGACKIENFIVEPTGALLSRPGFRYVMQAGSGNDAVRLIPFRFASDQTLVLVFTHLKMRIVTEGKMLLNDNGSVFELDSPYKGEDLFTIDYSQVADIITLTSNLYPPKELRRLGATDWEFTNVTTAPTITPPYNITAIANYPPETEDKDKGIVTVRYKVTAVDSEGRESIGSDPVEIKCNYWLTGATNTISWTLVPGAVRYRVYRDVAGVFGFLGETESATIEDQGDFTPDTTTTPPIYDQPFLAKTGIKSVKVINGGSGYPDPTTAINSACPTAIQMRNLPPIAYNTQISDLGDFLGASIPDKITVTFEIIDGSTGAVISSTTKDFIKMSQKSVSLSGNAGNAYSAIFAPADFTTSGFTLTFPSYASAEPYMKIKPAVGIFSDGVNSFGINGSYTYSRTAHTSSGTSSTETRYYSIQGVTTSDDWPLLNGFTEKQFGIICGTTATSAVAPAFVLNGRGALISDILKETEQGEQIMADNTVQIEVSDPTGEGAVLEAVVQNGVIIAVNVIESGHDYTNPTLTVVSPNGGSGAVLEAVLYTAEDNEYPAANTQFEQRRVFAGTLHTPLGVWLTNAGQQDLMMYHFPTLSDDRIELTAVASDADRIRHTVALESLLAFTGSGELRIYSMNGAMAPNTVAVRAQSYIGANNVQPVISNNVVLYAAARGGHMRAVQYAYTSSGYTCTDLSMVACHLFDGKTIKDLALAKAPSQIAWAVSSDGSLLGLTFTPEQNIAAWHRHVTDGKFESVCVVSEGDEDRLYAVIAREINGQTRKYIERLDNMVFEENQDARLLDSFIDNQDVHVSRKARSNTITGLSHLEGKTVKALVDGKDVGEFTVSNGQIDLPVSGDNVAVGLPYISTLVTVPLAANAQGNLQGSVKNIGEIFLRVKFDGDVWANTYPKKLLYRCKRENIEFANQGNESQVVRVSADGVWDYQGQIKVEHRDCVPLEIQAVIGNINAEGVR